MAALVQQLSKLEGGLVQQLSKLEGGGWRFISGGAAEARSLTAVTSAQRKLRSSKRALV